MMTSTIATEPTDAILRVTRAYIEELLSDILEAESSRAGSWTAPSTLDGVPDGYRAMADGEALKVMIKP